MLLPLSVPYLFGAWLERSLCARVRRPRVAVISVGNITAGGTGKTTLVQMLAGYLAARGWRTAVITTRKRGRLSGGRIGQEAAWLDDEAALLSWALPQTVVLSGTRKEQLLRRAGRMELDAVIIDDGFHCPDRWKDCDIVTIDALLPFDNGLVLPAGLLREPLCALRRADAFVITHSRLAGMRRTQRLIRRLRGFGKGIVLMDYRVASLTMPDGRVLAPEMVCGRDIIAFAGIGNPDSFYLLLSTLAPRRLFTVTFPDHTVYTDKDIDGLASLASEHRAELLLTTEKDMVKLRELVRGMPVAAVRVTPVLATLSGTPCGVDTLLASIL